MKTRLYILKTIALLVVSVSSLALIAVAMERRHQQPMPVQNVHPSPEKPITYDPALLKKFTNAIRSLDFNKSSCTYSGTVNLDDPNDTTNSVHEVRFTFCRSGSDFYYRLGPTELIRQGSLNLFIQHDQHKVVLSARPLTMRPPITDMGIIAKGLSSEGYTLSNTVQGTKQTLALVNEHHLSCRELSVTLDTVSGKLERIHSRLTDFGSPADKGKERLMDVRISAISSRSDMGLYPAATTIIKQSGGRWHLTGKYATYELISL